MQLWPAVLRSVCAAKPDKSLEAQLKASKRTSKGSKEFLSLLKAVTRDMPSLERDGENTAFYKLERKE